MERRSASTVSYKNHLECQVPMSAGARLKGAACGVFTDRDLFSCSRGSADWQQAILFGSTHAMNFSQFLLILNARRGIILLTLGITVAATLVLSLLLPKTYKASATLVLNYKGVDPVTGLTLPSQLMPGYMATQVDIIKSLGVALKVVDELKMADDPVVQRKFKEATDGGTGSIRNWQAEQLLKRLDVAPARESSFVTISFSNSNPDIAANVANTFAAAYQQVSNQIKADPSKRAAVYFNDQIKLLRENFENAQRKLSKYQQDNGIVNADSRLDVETANLNELSNQLVTVQAQKMEALSRGNQSENLGAAESPDVIANPLIQTLKAQLAQAEAKFKGIAEKVTPEYPPYQEAKAEVNKLRESLNQQTRAMSKSIGNNARILQQKESELRAALDAQKIKVLEINRKRDEFKVLSNEMENAQRAYETTMQRFTQINLEGQSNQSDVAVLTQAIPPLLPSSPKLPLNLLVATAIGTMLGLGFGLLAETLDRRVRSKADLVNAMQAPVLGIVVWAAPKQPRLALRTRLFLN
jgi:chain length determinant protein EpsF